MSVTMRTTLLLLSLACCLHWCVDGASIHHTSHSKLAGHHHTHKREGGKITHHQTPTHLQKKSAHHAKVHHVTAEKKTSEVVHDTKRAANTVDMEKVKRFLARILKSVKTAKHLPVHKTKVKKAVAEGAATSGSDKKARRLHTLLKKQGHHRDHSDEDYGESDEYEEGTEEPYDPTGFDFHIPDIPDLGDLDFGDLLPDWEDDDESKEPSINILLANLNAGGNGAQHVGGGVNTHRHLNGGPDDEETEVEVVTGEPTPDTTPGAVPSTTEVP